MNYKFPNIINNGKYFAKWYSSDVIDIIREYDFSKRKFYYYTTFVYYLCK